MVSNANFATIVRTTIDLAHQLGVKVVAEGVESAAIASELRALGCDIGQGYLFAKPMPKAEFLAALGRRMVGGPRRGALLREPAKLLRGLFAAS